MKEKGGTGEEDCSTGNSSFTTTTACSLGTLGEQEKCFQLNCYSEQEWQRGSIQSSARATLGEPYEKSFFNPDSTSEVVRHQLLPAQDVMSIRDHRESHRRFGCPDLKLNSRSHEELDIKNYCTKFTILDNNKANSDKEDWDKELEAAADVHNDEALQVQQLEFLYNQIEEVTPENISLWDEATERACMLFCEKFDLQPMHFSTLQQENLLPTKFHGDWFRMQNEQKYRIQRYHEKMNEEPKRDVWCDEVANAGDITDVILSRQIKFIFDEIGRAYPSRMGLWENVLSKAVHEYCIKFQLPQLTFTQLQMEDLVPVKFHDDMNLVRRKNIERIKDFQDDYNKQGFGTDDLDKLLVKGLRSCRAKAFFVKNLAVKVGKDKAASIAALNAGEEILKGANLNDEKLEKCFALFTKSIACAPLNSKELANAYRSRSGLLFRMKKRMECKAALGNNGSGNHLECESLYREGKQLMEESKETPSQSTVSLSSKAMKVLHMKKAKLDEPASIGTKKQKVHEHVQIYHRRKKDSYYDDVNIMFRDSEKLLYSMRDFAPGDIIYIEPPELARFDINYSHFNCDYCYAKSWTNIPCDYCNWSMYCSELCKQKAWDEYHNIECIVASHCKKISCTFNHPDFLALRCLLQGIKEFGGLQKLKDEVTTLDINMKYCEADPNNDENALHYSTGFKSIFTMSVAVQKITEKSVDVRNCEKMLIILAKATKFFGENVKFKCATDMAENPDVLFFGKVLLKLRQKIASSARFLYNPTRAFSDTQNCVNIEKCKGACLAPLSCLLKHSCYPNTKILITNHMSLIMFALRPINAGSLLLVAYDKNFLEQEQED
ncbi:SET and MYND domain-containing protein 4-like, partial [Copidosoma floridanum]|uniref:SET and MYND domain-containing protein 4-like n=1 Tax=Copidosoma floridanum TaxID=29053 RepID=UPI0006C97605